MTDIRNDSGKQTLQRASALLDREYRNARSEAALAATGTPDETTESLRKDASNMLEEMASNPSRYSDDPARATDWFLKATFLLALDRFLTGETGFVIDTAESPEPHILIHATSDRHPPETVEIRLLNVRGLDADPGHMILAREDDAGSELPAEGPAAVVHYDHAGYLLMQQIQNGEGPARMRRGLRSDVTSLRLARSARGMLEDMSANPQAYDIAPFQTKARLLRFAALLGADRMLSDPDAIGHDGLGDPGRGIRLYVPAERHPPESAELTLPAPLMH